MIVRVVETSLAVIFVRRTDTARRGGWLRSGGGRAVRFGLFELLTFAR